MSETDRCRNKRGLEVWRLVADRPAHANKLNKVCVCVCEQGSWKGRLTRQAVGGRQEKEDGKRVNDANEIERRKSEGATREKDRCKPRPEVGAVECIS